ncbi:MAG: hypothetical protein EB059_05880 [Alphaproteobacteria bacterium]|nr:hypothetical protein [Alphaproteobacteria bacterium]
MALNIKDPEADRLAREVAKQNGETITQAVVTALKERKKRKQPDKSEENVEEYVERIMKIVNAFSELPVYDNRTPDEIIGYNEHGHFD